MTIVDAEWIENWNAEYRRKQDLANPERATRRKAAALKAADERWEFENEAKRISNLTGSFSWKKVLTSNTLHHYLQFKHQGKTLCTFPAEASRTHWKELGKLLGVPKANAGSGDGNLWAYAVHQGSTIPKIAEDKHALLRLFEKALKDVYRRKADKMDSKRSSAIVDQLVRLDGLFDSLDYSTEDRKGAVRHYKAEAPYQDPKRAAKEATGSMLERAARKSLRRAKDFNEEDVEDIVACAWLQLHSEEVLKEELAKEGLEWTAENVEAMHGLIDERLRDTKAAAVATKRIAQHWLDEKKRLREVSVSATIGRNDNGNALLLGDVLQQTGATSNRQGVVQNQRMTPEQAVEEHREATKYANTESQIAQVAEALKPEELDWLLDFYAKDGPKTAAESQKAYRLRKKAVRLLPVE